MPKWSTQHYLLEKKYSTRINPNKLNQIHEYGL